MPSDDEIRRVEEALRFHFPVPPKSIEIVEAFDEAILFDMGRRMKAMLDEIIDGEPRNAVPSETDRPAPRP